MMTQINFIVMLLIMILVPLLLYTLFFLIKCPSSSSSSNPLTLFRHRSVNSGNNNNDGDGDGDDNSKKNDVELIIMSSNMMKGKVDTECPVCLSVFVEGEELRELKICKHLFHKNCIDKWVSMHFSCPVCRAFVSCSSQYKSCKEKEIGGFSSRDVVVGSRREGRSDLWQGLPDSSGLI